jgi:beta-galactosidase
MDTSRRRFNQLALSALALPALPALGSASTPRTRQPAQAKRRWNTDWRFQLGDDGSASNVGFDDDRWEKVTLPHWGRLENYDVSSSYQGLCWYRKTLASAGLRGRKVWLVCEGAMQVADVWVNGVHRQRHAGGYLPFRIDLSDDLLSSDRLQIAIRLDNRDNPAVPPGKPQSQLDFCYFSGLYRDVWLDVRDRLYLTDPLDAGVIAGGGVFVRQLAVSDAVAGMEVTAHARNEGAAAEVSFSIALYDGQGNAVSHVLSDVQPCDSNQDVAVRQQLRLSQPALWSPESPHLYTLKVRLLRQGTVVDEHSQRIGIRWLQTDPQRGFFLNGRHRVPSGANRHQAYPYVGNALSDRAQYREARKLKEAGFELIRLSHYPQAPAFLDACDELGLMVIECIPGWQHFQDSDAFRDAVEQDLRNLIRRDRHHACAVLWETSINETSGHDAFLRHLVEVAHEEYPGSQMLTCGDTEGHDYDAIRYEVPYSGWDDATHSRPSRAHGAMSLHREYGDNQFGAYSRYSRGDGERLMLVQAWNYQTALNQQLRLPYTWGQCAWEAIDNNRGMGPGIATCGALDLFRLPKFLFHFFRSQRSPDLHSESFDSGPMVYIANYWKADSPRDVVVFSNADEVRLLLDGREIGRQRPDHGPDRPFGDDSGFNLNYWLSHSEAPPKDERRRDTHQPVYDGGNGGALLHPPFTFKDVGFQPGELKAVAYRDGRSVAEHLRRTPGAPVGLRLRVELDGQPLAADGGDLVFVHADIVDAAGTVVPDASMPVHFELEGAGMLIGDNPHRAEAGIASILLRAGTHAGAIRLGASSAGLGKARATVRAADVANLAQVP